MQPNCAWTGNCVGWCMIPMTPASLAAVAEGGSPGADTSSQLDFTSFSSWRSLRVLRGGRPVAAAGVGLTTAWSVQKSSYPHFSTTCVRSLCGKAEWSTKMTPAFTLSFGGLNGSLIERCSVTPARSWTRRRWRGGERKTGQLLPAGRTKLERRLQLLPTLRAKVDGHSAKIKNEKWKRITDVVSDSDPVNWGDSSAMQVNAAIKWATESILLQVAKIDTEMRQDWYEISFFNVRLQKLTSDTLRLIHV